MLPNVYSNLDGSSGASVSRPRSLRFLQTDPPAITNPPTSTTSWGLQTSCKMSNGTPEGHNLRHFRRFQPPEALSLGLSPLGSKVSLSEPTRSRQPAHAPDLLGLPNLIKTTDAPPRATTPDTFVTSSPSQL